MSDPLRWCWAGRLLYEDALALQLALAARREAGEGRDVLLLLEHDPVFTAGRRATDEELLWNEEARSVRGVRLVDTDRGGKLTFHGPGQLVGYPIVSLKERNLGVRAWVEKIEWSLIDYLRKFRIEGKINCGFPGVWVGDEKVAALGLHVRRGISYHGFAINVSTDLSFYDGIVPCGISDRRPTSIEKLAGKGPAIDQAARDIAWSLANRLGVPLEEITLPSLREEVHAMSATGASHES